MIHRPILINESQRRRLLESLREQRSSWSTYSPRLEAIERGLRWHVETPPGTVGTQAMVTLGSRVRVRDIGTVGAGPAARDWLIVYPECADPQMGALSIFSPLGWALLGGRPGDRITYDEGKGIVRCEIEYVVSPVSAPDAATSSCCPGEIE